MERAGRLAADALRAVPADAWDGKAGPLERDRWGPVEHLNDDLFAYAAQLAPRNPPLHGKVPFLWESRRPGGPANAIHADRAAGPGGRIRRAAGRRRAREIAAGPDPPHLRRGEPGRFRRDGSWKRWCTRTTRWTVQPSAGSRPPSCARVLARLFPHAPGLSSPAGCAAVDDRTRRAAGHLRLNSWRWYGAPAAGS